jgi:putative oxidoreductase
MVGLGFFEHDCAKLARGPDGFIAILRAMGMPFANLLGWATIIVEIAGGSMILLGAFVPVAAVPMIIVLLVAIFTVHLPWIQLDQAVVIQRNRRRARLNSEQ